jgi:hypothetical protein
VSALDAPPHVVQVWLEVDGTDAEGNPARVPASSPVNVRCSVHYLTTQESAEVGQTTTTRARIYARRFPAGAYARVQWDGRTWDVDGEPRRFGRTEAVVHDEVDLLARVPDPLPIGG